MLFAVCLYACLSLLVPGQYAATWGKYALLQWSGGGHHAAELGCGRLRRCPVIRPVTDRGIRDTPYDRRRTLTAAYRAGACLSLDDFPAVSSQRLLQNCSFLICAELISALFLFLRYRDVGKCRDKTVSKNAGRIFLPFRLFTILPAFAVLFNSDGHPFFGRAHFDILRVLNQSEKLLIMLSTRACSAST